MNFGSRAQAHALMSVVNPLWAQLSGQRQWPGSMSYVGPRAGEEARRQDVGDQALMRGLATAFPNVRPRLSLSYCGHHCRGGHNACAGRSSTVASPPPPHANRQGTRSELAVNSGGRHRPHDGPHECGQFAGDSRHGHRRLLASRRERPEPRAQSALRFPGDVADRRRDRCKWSSFTFPIRGG